MCLTPRVPQQALFKRQSPPGGISLIGVCIIIYTSLCSSTVVVPLNIEWLTAYQGLPSFKKKNT